MGGCDVHNLYITEKGAYFLEVKEEDITPKKVEVLTEKKAKEFMNKYAAEVDIEAYERIFGEAEKG